MKRLVFAGVAATIAIPLSSANAAVVTVGPGLARSCFEASDARAPSPVGFDACNRAFSEEPLDRHDTVATHVNRGILYFLAGNLAAASSDYDQALALDPTEAEAWLDKAMIAMKTGDSRTAATMFDRALQLRTTRPALAYYGRAIVNEDVGNLRDAYADLLKARALEPRWAAPAEELKRYVIR